MQGATQRRIVAKLGIAEDGGDVHAGRAYLA